MAGNHKKSASERETATPTLSAAVAQHRRLFNSMETEKSAAQMELSQWLDPANILCIFCFSDDIPFFRNIHE
jgi:hypothetical protein